MRANTVHPGQEYSFSTNESADPVKILDLCVKVGIGSRNIHYWQDQVDQNPFTVLTNVDGKEWGRQLIGLGFLFDRPTEYAIENLMVDQWHQNKGIGRHMLDTLLTEAQAREPKPIVIRSIQDGGVHRDNDRHRAWLKKRGFYGLGDTMTYAPGRLPAPQRTT